MTRTHQADEYADISKRIAEIQAERMAAIQGCSCPQDALGKTSHSSSCPLRPMISVAVAVGGTLSSIAEQRVVGIDLSNKLLTAATLTAEQVTVLQRRWEAQTRGITEPQKALSRSWRHSLNGTLIALGMALSFDPHLLLLSWSAERQETIPATSRATCDAAISAIAEGRWMANDPPAAMRCIQGNGFAPGSDCIAGFNCRGESRGASR